MSRFLIKPIFFEGAKSLDLCNAHLVPGPGPVQGEVADQGVLQVSGAGGLVPGGDHHPAPLCVLIQHLSPARLVVSLHQEL